MDNLIHFIAGLNVGLFVGYLFLRAFKRKIEEGLDEERRKLRIEIENRIHELQQPNN